MEGGYFLIYSLLTLRIFIQLENPKLCIEEIQTHSKEREFLIFHYAAKL